MKWVETAIIYLFPDVLLDGKPWRQMWEDKEREIFTTICKYLFFFAGLVYFGHYFYYDKPMGLQPIERWFAFRMVVTTTAFCAAAFYISPLAKTKYYKLPAVAATWVFCYTQAMIVTWWDGTPWLYSFVFVLASMIILRVSPVMSMLLATAFMTSQTHFLIEAGVPLSSIISTGVFVLLVIVVIRSSYIADIRNFVLNQENVAAQKQIIELNIEFADRLRAFIPKVIARRLERYVNDSRLTILQAAVEVLRPRETNVACLFSDIRGYTQGSKDLQAFINNSVLPEVKACSDMVEDHDGIPRKVGDLIFAYFDSDDPHRNILNSLMAAMEIARLNQDMNATLSETEIRRYILLSSGEAIVGNLGGLDSSIEITALGSPVNFLSRLDDLTKEPTIANLLSPGDIITCENTISSLKTIGIRLDFQHIDVHGLNLSIRDFPETQSVFRIAPSDSNFERVRAVYECLISPETQLGYLDGKYAAGQV